MLILTDSYSEGLRFHATGLWQSGVSLGGKIGTLANPSDLVSAHTTRLDSFWLEQNFLSNKIRIRAGQLAGLDFYGNQEYGGSWLINRWVTPLAICSVPYTNRSIRPARLEPRSASRRGENFYVNSAVMAGNRNPYQQDPTGTNFQISDTPDFLFEAGYLVNQSDARGGSSSASGKSYPGA